MGEGLCSHREPISRRVLLHLATKAPRPEYPRANVMPTACAHQFDPLTERRRRIHVRCRRGTRYECSNLFKGMARPSLASLNQLADMLRRAQPLYELSHRVMNLMQNGARCGRVAR